MRLLGAELLKIRRRTATYVVLLVVLLLMLLVLSLAAEQRDIVRQIMRFPVVWSTIGDWSMGDLGSLLAIAYAAAIAGADWNWGVLRNVIARGESRIGYVLAKALAIAIALAVGVAIIFAVGVPLSLLVVALNGLAAGDPLSPASIAALRDQLLLSFPVLLERAAIGFAVAVVLRSQLAGVIVGIVLFIGEQILFTILVVTNLPNLAGGLFGEFERLPVQWFQFLPFTIGNQVRAAASSTPDDFTGDFFGLFMTRVELPLAMATLLAYVLLAITLSAYRAWREEIVA